LSSFIDIFTPRQPFTNLPPEPISFGTHLRYLISVVKRGYSRDTRLSHAWHKRIKIGHSGWPKRPYRREAAIRPNKSLCHWRGWSLKFPISARTGNFGGHLARQRPINRGFERLIASAKNKNGHFEPLVRSRRHKSWVKPGFLIGSRRTFPPVGPGCGDQISLPIYRHPPVGAPAFLCVFVRGTGRWRPPGIVGSCNRTRD